MNPVSAQPGFPYDAVCKVRCKNVGYFLLSQSALTVIQRFLCPGDHLSVLYFISTERQPMVTHPSRSFVIIESHVIIDDDERLAQSSAYKSLYPCDHCVIDEDQ
jgi:hypothetical protein